MKKVFFALLGVSLLAGGHANATEIDQSNLCIIHTPIKVTADQCKPGQKIELNTNSMSAEYARRHAIRFASENCDLRYQVVISDGKGGGVTCIYAPTNDPE